MASGQDFRMLFSRTGLTLRRIGLMQRLTARLTVLDAPGFGLSEQLQNYLQ